MPSAGSIYLHSGEGPDWQADRVVMLDRGQMVASGRHAGLVAPTGPSTQLIAAQRRHV